MLADASEEDIRRFQDELRKTKHRTSVDLQTNVYQNRTQFIKISKEAEKLKSEMRTLRQLMSDLTTTLEQTASASNTETDMASTRRANRAPSVTLTRSVPANCSNSTETSRGRRSICRPFLGVLSSGGRRGGLS
jgi:hypothetical protein